MNPRNTDSYAWTFHSRNCRRCLTGHDFHATNPRSLCPVWRAHVRGEDDGFIDVAEMRCRAFIDKSADLFVKEVAP